MEHLDRLEPEGLDSVEQPLAGPQQDGDHVEREFVDNSGGERLTDGRGAARDVDDREARVTERDMPVARSAEPLALAVGPAPADALGYSKMLALPGIAALLGLTVYWARRN